LDLEDLSINMLEEEAGLWDSKVAMADEQRRAQFVAFTVCAADMLTQEI
jgi:hypothetical protein